MKTMMKKVTRDESGKILILVLVLLVVGGLLLTPLLGLMSTGLVAGQVYEKKAAELYAADAGVEDVLWQIKRLPQDPTRVPSTPGQEVKYPLEDAVNNKEVQVAVAMISGRIGNALYWVTSEAGAGGSDTRIQSYVQSFPFLWGNAITSTGKVELKPNTYVYGDVYGNVTGPGTILDGKPYPPYHPDSWPSYEDLRGFYWPPVLETPLLPTECKKSELAIEGQHPYRLGPGHHYGNLKIVNDSKGDVTEAVLMGVVYIKEDMAGLQITQGNTNWVLDLNGQTIYVEGKDKLGNNEWALEMGNRVSIKGSGVIIAEGNIKFQPNMSAGSEDDFVFVMSVLGEVYFQPRGTFYGSVAGRQVRLWPDQTPGNPERTVTYTEPPPGLIFPFDKVESRLRILTWEIS